MVASPGLSTYCRAAAAEEQGEADKSVYKMSHNHVSISMKQDLVSDAPSSSSSSSSIHHFRRAVVGLMRIRIPTRFRGKWEMKGMMSSRRSRKWMTLSKKSIFSHSLPGLAGHGRTVGIRLKQGDLFCFLTNNTPASRLIVHYCGHSLASLAD